MEYLLSRRRYGLTEDGEAYLEFLASSWTSRSRTCWKPPATAAWWNPAAVERAF
jgi:hypothetical protein